MVSQKFNLSPAVSQPLADIVAQLKSKLPEGISQHVDGLLAGDPRPKVCSTKSKVKGLAGGLMGKAY
jgi:hypothetical protein